jgi:hypothetical protein
MAKTVPPGTIVIPQVGAFSADALPDPFDERDLEYRPRLEPLPVVLDQRQGTDERYVMRQDGNSCTGHALAAAINAVLARPAPAADDDPAREPYPHVSPYMLYRLARRYDEFAGDSDVGSSLRGGLKGWFNHGVLLEGDWPVLLQDPEPDLDDEAIVEKARERPLGAFYRVSPYRLDDMQSAISELSAICASAVVHEGWVAPVELTRKGENLRVIVRPANARVLGGHAFALVGYNEVGFLVQNSWGPTGARAGSRPCRTKIGSNRPTTPGWPVPVCPRRRSPAGDQAPRRPPAGTSRPAPRRTFAAWRCTWSTWATRGGCHRTASSPAHQRRSSARSNTCSDGSQASGESVSRQAQPRRLSRAVHALL